MTARQLDKFRQAFSWHPDIAARSRVELLAIMSGDLGADAGGGVVRGERGEASGGQAVGASVGFGEAFRVAVASAL